MPVQPGARTAAPLNEQGLVNRFVGHPHPAPGRESLTEVETDLLRAPLHAQFGLHQGCQLGMVELTGLGPAPAELGPLLRSMWSISPTRAAVAPQLTAHGRSRPP